MIKNYSLEPGRRACERCANDSAFARAGFWGLLAFVALPGLRSAPAQPAAPRPAVPNPAELIQALTPDQLRSAQTAAGIRRTLTPQQLAEEPYIFTPPGFTQAGEPRWESQLAWMNGGRTGHLEIVVRDAVTGQPTPCRINVVGRDGNFYQPPHDRLSRFSLTGVFTLGGMAYGNKLGKGPYRYVGRFFYSMGEARVRAIEGAARIEVWKGYEYRPEVVNVNVPAGGVEKVEVVLTRVAPMATESYYAGDTHQHFPRETDADDPLIFDLMEAEDFRYCYNMSGNVPAGPYAGFMDSMVYPQHQLGRSSMRQRGNLHIMSGEEYRADMYGHLNLFFRNDLAAPGKSYDANTWPVFGVIGRETNARGGYAFMAHGGHGKEVYADAALGAINGIELLQFGVYRDIGLENWYNMLGSGYRFAAHGGSDYPGSRFLADARTYVHHSGEPTLDEWLAGLAGGRSFFTTGPLLLLEIDGQKPGAQIRKQGGGRHTVNARVRMCCEVTPVTDLDLIVSGKIVKSLKLSPGDAKDRWVELEHSIELGESAWIAARAHSKSPGGQPDAEAHTNPVYVYLNNRAPFQRAAVDAWIAKVDGQIAIHAKRIFPENARVLNYFQQARDVLLRIRAENGLSADADPATFAKEKFSAAPGTRDLLLEGSASNISDAEMKAFLASGAVPPKSPAESLATFETLPGFRLELVAAEPMVRSPIVGAFDEDGNLYVGEMLDYPFNPYTRAKLSWQRPQGTKPLGAVRLLRDGDGDGVYDQSTVFADELLWAGGIVPWKGGIYVIAPPDLLYLKDTDGDGKADIRQTVFTGFGLEGQQGAANGLQFGLDHKIHGSGNHNGGEIRSGDASNAAAITLDGYNFSFTPQTHRFELQTGFKQFGLSFDDWGNLFTCDQGNPAFHIVLPQRYLARSPYFSPPAKIVNLAPPAVPIYRISPVERWRHIKSSRRFAGMERQADLAASTIVALVRRQPGEGLRSAAAGGVSHHVVDATAGVTVYRGGAYPPDFYGNLVVGDSVANLVHRRRLVPDGATFKSERVDEKTEFLRSSDNWFHPVNFVNAPDGTLYCIDMGREFSETVNIPPDVEKHMDLTSGKERGRIYRIAPDGFRPPPPPRLSRASTAELVRTLESPHGWWRDTAHRLLFERQDRSAIPALEQLLQQGQSPQTRVHALWSLQGLQVLNDATIVKGLGDSHPGVRENAVRLSESRLDASEEIRERVAALAADPEPRVRLQVAFTVGESRRWNQAVLLARLARENLDDPWIQSAVISSAAECGGELLAAAGTAAVLANAKGLEFLRRLAAVVGFQNRPADLARVLDTLAALPDRAVGLDLLAALGDGLNRAGTSLLAVDPAGKTKVLLERAPSIAMDGAQPDAARRAAIETLALMRYEDAAPTLARLLAPGQSPARQQAAVRVLGKFAGSAAGRVLLEHYSDLAPAARTPALDILLERTDRIQLLLDAVKGGKVPREDLSAKHVSLLRQHGDERIRERTADLLGAANPAKRQDVVRGYLPALDLAGVAAKGRAIFESRCSACHQVAGIGSPYGPDLTGAAAGGKEKLLTGILDPNRDVAAQYFLHLVSTKSGESTGGILKNETATAVTLLQVGGLEKTIARARIAKMETMRQSLMPEGLEGGLTTQDMADLIEFLVNPGK